MILVIAEGIAKAIQLASGVANGLTADGGLQAFATVLAAFLAVVGSFFSARYGAKKGVEAARTAAEDERRAALRALATEFTLNLDLAEEYKGSIKLAQTTVAWVPFGREALDAALRYLTSLPDHVRTPIQTASHVIGRYNTLATYHNTHIDPDRVILDNAAISPFSSWLFGSDALTRYLDDAKPVLNQAVSVLEIYIDELDVTHRT